MKINKIFLLLTLTLLLLGITYATDTTNDTTNTNTIASKIQTTNTPTQTVEDNTKYEEHYNKEINKQNEKNTKTASQTVEVNDFDTLHNTLTSNEYDTLTLNIKSDIQLNNNTTVSDSISQLTINGNGKTINGNNQYRFLSIHTNSDVLIKNIKITNCNNSAIYNFGILYLSNTTLTNNYRAISNEGSITINNCNITNNFKNYSSNYSNWLDHNIRGGGAITNWKGTININNSNISNNIKSQGDYIDEATDIIGGGAITNWHGVVTINNSNINNNKAHGSGGAISNCDNMSIYNSNLNNNYVKWGDGGAIDNTGNMDIINCNLNNNSIWGDLCQDVYGGAICTKGNNLTIINSTLLQNRKDTEHWDGRGYSYGGAIFHNYAITIINCTFNKNTPTTIEPNPIYCVYKSRINTKLYKNSVNLYVDITQPTLGEDIIINILLTDVRGNKYENCSISVLINQENYSVITDNNGEAIFYYTPQHAGEFQIEINFIGNKTFSNKNVNVNVLISYKNPPVATRSITTTIPNKDPPLIIQSTAITIPKIDTNISINTANVTSYGETVKITGQLTDLKGNKLSNTTIQMIINDDIFNLTTNNEGFYSFDYISNKTGLNQIQVIYEGNENYSTSNNTHSFTVNKKDAKLTLNNINTTLIGDKINITGKLTDINNNPLTNVNVNIIINDKESLIVTDDNGEIIFKIQAEILGTNNVTLLFNGTSIYNSNMTNISFNVITKDTKLTINQINTTQYSDNIIITGTLTTVDNDTINYAPITIIVNNDTYSEKTNEKGIFTLYYKTNTIGINNITTLYNGNNTLTNTTTQQTFIVEKQDTKITINKIPDTTYNQNITINGTLNDKNNNILINMPIKLTLNNETTNLTTNNEGIFTYTNKTLVTGQNNITVKYEDNIYYNPSETTTSFIVKKQDLKITINPIKDVIYGHNVTITGKFTDGLGNPRQNNALKLYINGKSISTRTDNDGKFSVTSKVGVIGTNNVTTNHSGDKNYNPTNRTATFTMKKQNLKVTIDPIQTVTYGNPVVISGTFTDGDGNPRPNNNLKININGKSGSATTDKNGKYTFTSTIGKLGTNNVTVSHTGGANYNPTNKTTTYTVTKQDLKITLEDLGTMTYGPVTIKGKLTDALGNIRANTGVKLLINGKSATAKTNNKGEFTFTTKACKVGTNNITASHNGGGNYNPTSTSTTFNMIKQDLKVTIDPITTVTYGNPVVITGTFTDGNGKIRANSAIRVIINGKTLTTRTDANGKFRATSKVGNVGINNVTVAHSGGTGFNPTSSSTTFTMIKQDLKITINPISNVKKGSTVTVTGTFTDANGKVRANTNLKVNLNGKEDTTKTDTKGLFTYTTTANTLGTNSITLSHNGGANYNPTETTTKFTVSY